MIVISLYNFAYVNNLFKQSDNKNYFSRLNNHNVYLIML